ncbi:MAG TPA: PDZ domain-containing protein [Burkholderiaceae bacterium]|nr:PDZ domain-containing protein [Burkholderiaceae bacterium]
MTGALRLTGPFDMLRRTLLSALLALVAPPMAVQAEDTPKPGTLGFAVAIDGDGSFFNPTLKTVTIKSVVPGRPAAIAGITPGDQIVEVEGRQVAGRKAGDLQPLMRKNAGETLGLRLRKPGGEVYAVVLVAAPKD